MTSLDEYLSGLRGETIDARTKEITALQQRHAQGLAILELTSSPEWERLLDALRGQRDEIVKELSNPSVTDLHKIGFLRGRLSAIAYFLNRKEEVARFVERANRDLEVLRQERKTGRPQKVKED
jgi:hypothetical protein